MKALEPPDSFYLEDARSLLESGDPKGSKRELAKIAEGLRLHPDVREVLWGIHAQLSEWPACLDIAQAIVNSAPERPTGWIKRSFVLHRLKRTQEALDNLFAAVEVFPEIAIIPYNLACYAAQLQCLWEAEQWLKRAFEIGGREYEEMALRDRMLKSLWKSIGKP